MAAKFCGYSDWITRVLQSVRALQKQHRPLRNLSPGFLCVFPIVQSDTKNHSRLQRREQFDHVRFTSSDFEGLENVAANIKTTAIRLFGRKSYVSLLRKITNDPHGRITR